MLKLGSVLPENPLVVVGYTSERTTAAEQKHRVSALAVAEDGPGAV